MLALQSRSSVAATHAIYKYMGTYTETPLEHRVLANTVNNAADLHYRCRHCRSAGVASGCTQEDHWKFEHVILDESGAHGPLAIESPF